MRTPMPWAPLATTPIEDTMWQAAFQTCPVLSALVIRHMIKTNERLDALEAAEAARTAAAANEWPPNNLGVGG